MFRLGGRIEVDQGMGNSARHDPDHLHFFAPSPPRQRHGEGIAGELARRGSVEPSRAIDSIQ